MAKADLSRVPLAEALRDLHIRRSTGLLTVRRGHHKKELQFAAGEVLGVRSDLLEDSLGRAVVKWGLLTEEDARELGDDVEQDLAEKGVLDGEAFQEFLTQLQREWALGLFLWKEGEIQFAKAESGAGDGQPVFTVPNLILEGVRRSTGFDPVRERLLWANPVMKLNPSPPISMDTVSLHPQEGYLFSLVDGTANLQEILTLSPLGEEETLRLAYAFLVLGILLAPHQGGRGKKEETLFSIRRFGEQEERVAERIEDAVFKLRSVNERLSELDDWQVLGLEEEASIDEVNKVYQELIKRYLPERFPPEVKKQCRRELDLINARIGAAYLALTERGIGQAAIASGLLKTHRRLRTREEIEAERMEAVEAAKGFIKRAKEAEASRDFHTAIQYTELASRRDPENPSHHAYHAHLLSKNPQWAKRAETALRQAIELDPDNARYHWELAHLYLRSNFTSKARHEFEKTAELDPKRADEVKDLLRRLR